MIRDAGSGIPLRVPPPGVVPNFANPIFLGLPVLVAGGISLGIVAIFTATRLYATIAVKKRWKFDDYAYYFCCAAVLAMISFEVSIVLAKPNGYHAWDIDSEMSYKSRSPVIQILVYSMALGPVVWLIKLTLFCSMLREFGYVRWIKNCAYAGIVITGLFCSAYTVVVALACGPRPNTDADSYWSGFQRKQCSSSNGVSAIASIIFGTLNFASDVYLVALPLSPVSSMLLPAKQKMGVYTIVLSGLVMCICSLIGLVYRIRSRKSTDFTGSQIPIYAAIIAQLSIGIMILCMPSIHTIYRYYTVPDINDTTTLATSNTKGFSSLSSEPSPKADSRATWRKTHLSIEEIPYRKASEEWKRHSKHDSRMKALPPTPLLLNPASIPPSPGEPKTPTSFKSMHLPIMFHTSSQ